MSNRCGFLGGARGALLSATSMKRLVSRAVIPVCCLALAQCQAPDVQTLGQFQVNGNMTSNTCGAQTGLFDAQFRFPVELAVGRGGLQWKPVGVDAQGATGTWSRGNFRLENESETTLAAPARRTGFAVSRVAVGAPSRIRCAHAHAKRMPTQWSPRWIRMR